LNFEITVGGIVLAGGRSSRMGSAKAELPFGPERMLARVLRLLGEVVRPIVVVAAPSQEVRDLTPDVLVARDEREARGPLEGLRAGMAAVAPYADAVYATSCDVPLLAPAFVRAMIERLGDFDAAVPVEGEFAHPLAAVYRTSVLPEIERLLDADQLRPAYLFERVKTCRVPVAELTAVDPALSTLRNLNRRADYLAALAEAGLEADPAVLAALGMTDNG
jgi:molybdopterin-guanine dinucleotide biosynthesis protein A